MEYTYITKPCGSLDDAMWSECATLFSENYGRYSSKSPKRPGQQISMSPDLYKRYYAGVKGMYVSLCIDDTRKLIGQAFFLRKDVKGKGICSWVTQLVVHRSYRNRRIGSRLLQSAWGFSDYYAWGLATANAITLKTLEAVTWRELSADDMLRNIDVLQTIMDDIPFVDKNKVKLDRSQSQVFTNFYPEFEPFNKKDALQVYAARLGEIESGYEWLAFTFADQKINYTQEHFSSFLEFSEQQLKDAYERMDMDAQGWTKGTSSEVSFIIGHTQATPQSSILDIGCGQGRHVVELAKRGFEHVEGVDFSEKNITKARQSVPNGCRVIPGFICADARKLMLGRQFDVVMCLYDVIGSFRDSEDNKRILKTIKRHLRRDGRAVVSVMNMTLTEQIATHRCHLSEKPEMLLHLKPSDTMARKGDIFNPDFFLLNEDDGLVYRKEQFSEDGLLFSEYLVADKRYTREEFELMASEVGLDVKESYYVQAGWKKHLTATDPHAKEILFVLSHK